MTDTTTTLENGCCEEGKRANAVTRWPRSLRCARTFSTHDIAVAFQNQERLSFSTL